MSIPRIELFYNPNDKSFIGIDSLYPQSTFVESIHLQVESEGHCFRQKMTLDDARKLQSELPGIIQSLNE